MQLCHSCLAATWDLRGMPPRRSDTASMRGLPSTRWEARYKLLTKAGPVVAIHAALVRHPRVGGSELVRRPAKLGRAPPPPTISRSATALLIIPIGTAAGAAVTIQIIARTSLPGDRAGGDRNGD